MRLVSVSVRNYRIHRELTVAFDPSRTLIGGPNESGKSTLAEAVHRALFLGARGSNRLITAMRSDLHPGHPEVELTFEAGGRTCTLRKRFGGSGSTSLVIGHGATLTGDEAEAELAGLLGSDPDRSLGDRQTQWSHLWVWQGSAGDDPAGQATAQRDGLLRRLQEMGGGALLETDLDTRVANSFMEAAGEFFTQRDQPRAGSDLARASEDLTQAERDLESARGKVRDLESAATDLESATRGLESAAAILEGLERERRSLEEKERALGELRLREGEEARAAEEAARHHGELQDADRRIGLLRREVADLEEALLPLRREIGILKAAADASGGEATRSEREHREGAEAERQARLRHDLALVSLRLLEKREEHRRLREREEQARLLGEEQKDLETRAAGLPAVDQAAFRRLAKLQQEWLGARAALEAMAAGIEVVQSDLPVVAGGRHLGIGGKVIVTEETDLWLGDTVHLRLSPGGGTSLAEARSREAELQGGFQAALDGVGLGSLEDASASLARREEIAARLASIRDRLDGMEAGSLEQDLAAARREEVAAGADLDRLHVLVPGLPLPESREEARDLADRLKEDFRAAEDRVNGLRAAAEEARAHREALWGKLAGRQDAVAEQERRITGLTANLDLLLRTHGQDAERIPALVQAERAEATAAHRRDATRREIAALQPELLAREGERIRRAVEAKTRERNDLQQRAADARAMLRSDGSVDPRGLLAAAEERRRTAAARRDAVDRRARAVKRLADLFTAQRQTLAAKFTQPLSDRISGYLACIFGPGAEAGLQFGERGFSGFCLHRPEIGDRTFTYDALSGGTREQTAAAFRLAMAEVLAADHGGCLPVVLDDAFAYSDPERVGQLQRMLDLAATRGLQVIVLTCNPDDYAGLGARQVVLPPGGRGRAPAPAPPAGPVGPGEEGDDSPPPPPGLFADAPGVEREFLARLAAMGGSAGNKALRDALGWDEATYGRVKERLLAAGHLLAGRGRGGSVALPSDGGAPDVG